MRYFEPTPPRILAHRGLALEAPENTLAAFRAAFDIGVTHMETDAHVTKDGVAVLWHDPTLERWDGSKTRIASLTLGELHQRTRDGHQMVTVSEALEALPDAFFNIDVKDPAATDAVCDGVQWVEAEERVLLTSFSEATCRRLRARLPLAAHGASARRVAAAVWAILRGNERKLDLALGDCDVVQVPPRMARVDLVTRKRLAAYKRHVDEVHVWTINDPGEMMQLLDMGVDGIVTDRADRAMSLLSDFRG
ncbi:glycerophosphodiester phosphodiesterase family protein [Gulosibacter sp. 10]|uniref:glycerophosphodiester phosphodiesterase family protein n=1 Tax=Gulosibacter sp. 10 TaxID=1255570 RepID=UPI00097E79E8|nr:glycerophosphodiester phosphodiesterase family protein [Gulosibacter sp. 10]SJM52771.1 Glycerophosphoryl diester phosphodiesterase [Gulosibacter sp. 10]